MEGRGVKDSPLWRLCLAGFMLWALAACGELEPMVEPEVSDLQLTVDALKTQVRDTQRNLAELRAEMEARRQELAEAHVARAQLEGRLREAERRLAEARQIVNLQREELMVARAEREKIARGSLQLQSQLRQMQKRGTKGNPVPESAPEEIPTAGAAIKRAQKAAARPVPPALPSAVSTTGHGPTPASLVQDMPSATTASEGDKPSSSMRAVSVVPGDTLWSIARKYRVGLGRLRSLNHMTDNRLIVGQAIWVPVARASRDIGGGQSENKP